MYIISNILPFFCIPPPPGLLPVLGPLERYMTPTLDSALLVSSRAGADLGRPSDRLRSFIVIFINSGDLKSKLVWYSNGPKLVFDKRKKNMGKNTA